MRNRGRITYANVVSTLCLVLIVGGAGAYASVKLARNSVGTKQLKQGAVTLAKINQDAIGALKGARGATGAAGSHGLAGAPGATGPTGPQGIQGLQGMQGQPGLSGVELLTDVTPNASSGEDQVVCPQGKKVLGGGYKADGGNFTAVSSYPDTSGSSEAWTVRIDIPVEESPSLTTYAICATVP